MTRSARRRVVVSLLSALAFGCRASPADVVQLWAVGREGEVVQDLMPEFERRHPGVAVRVQQIPWSAAHEKLITAYVGGAMPDVFQAGNTWLPELVALDALEPLDARIARSGSVARDDYFPGILDTNVIDDTTWGVPWYVDTRLLFYRSDLLAAVGGPSPPRTWDEWLLAMTRLKTRAGADGFAVLLPLQEWQVPVILAFQRGAALLRDGDRFGDFRSPAFRAGFGFYLDLFRRGLAPRAGDTAVTNVYQDFARGYFGFYVSGPWNLGEFARRLPPDLAGRWETAPWPAPNPASSPASGPAAAGSGSAYPGVSLAGGASLVVSRGSTRKDAAWTLVEYLSEPAQQVRLHELTGDLPARRAAWQAAGLAGERGAGAFWLQLQSVRSTPKIPEWERIAALIGRYAETAIRGDMTVDEALAGLDHDVDAVLEKRRWLLDDAKADR